MNWTETVRRVTDKHIIGDRCPCDKCGTKVKHRAVLALLWLPITVAGVSYLAGYEYGGYYALATLLAWHMALKPMYRCINEQMPEICQNTGMVVKE